MLAARVSKTKRFFTAAGQLTDCSAKERERETEGVRERERRKGKAFKAFSQFHMHSFVFWLPLFFFHPNHLRLDRNQIVLSKPTSAFKSERT